MAYAGYDDYAGLWHGGMPEAAFVQWAARASVEMDRLTQGRAAAAPPEMAGALRLCCCALAERLYAWDAQDRQTQGGTVASESVDGYSVSYRGAKEAPDRAADRRRELYRICADSLTYPVNLMYTGVQP